jgi:hypothetical protein
MLHCRTRPVAICSAGLPESTFKVSARYVVPVFDALDVRWHSIGLHLHLHLHLNFLGKVYLWSIYILVYSVFRSNPTYYPRGKNLSNMQYALVNRETKKRAREKKMKEQ